MPNDLGDTMNNSNRITSADVSNKENENNITVSIYIVSLSIILEDFFDYTTNQTAKIVMAF